MLHFPLLDTQVMLALQEKGLAFSTCTVYCFMVEQWAQFIGVGIPEAEADSWLTHLPAMLFTRTNLIYPDLNSGLGADVEFCTGNVKIDVDRSCGRQEICQNVDVICFHQQFKIN